ncbi:MAG TPA: NUDIX domain-containing protein [Acidimicrobiales bacterium]|nr:NUDIX domain-containing protein [Acidimicrobiales bacterium]
MVERAELVRLVAAHEPADERERDAKAHFLVELDRLERPWDQGADPVHVTASAVVVGARGTVLHRHRLLGRWLQPGGHLEAGESPAEAARREVTEETGLVAAHPDGGPLLLRLDVHRAGPSLQHTHLDLCYLLAGPDRDPEPGDGESPDARWWDWEDARSVADEPLRGALDAARSREAGR